MKDISFWQEKLNEVKRKIHQNTIEIRILKDFESDLFLTSRYYKIRQLALKLRSKRLTKIGKLQRENKRLRETKLTFYQKKIAELTNE